MSSDCPSPPCPVATADDVDLRLRRVVTWPRDTRLHRVGDAHRPLDALDPSDVVGRFSPRPGWAHVYVARRQTIALLETVFHDVGPDPASRRVFQDVALRGMHLGKVTTARQLRLLDLRDDALDHLGLPRSQVVTTTAMHYPCTTAWVDRMVTSPVGGGLLDGAVWHSRVAEVGRTKGSDLAEDLLHGDVAEVAVLYGHASSRLLRAAGGPIDLLPRRDRWPPLVDEVAELLGAEIH